MIHLRFMGHIKTSMGAEEMEFSGEPMSVGDLFGILLARRPARLDHGFTEFNTLVVINDGEVFSAATQRDRVIGDGDSVLLLPFSHGG